jgi:hypothetical protein
MPTTLSIAFERGKTKGLLDPLFVLLLVVPVFSLLLTLALSDGKGLDDWGLDAGAASSSSP